MSKKPIDRKRDAAVSIRIGSDDDQSPLTDFYQIGDHRMLHVKGRAIYEVKLPDNIDPARTNFDLEAIQSRVLNYGSDDPIVCRVLLTAKELFRQPGHLRPDFDYTRALALAFECLKCLVAMRQFHDDLDRAQNIEWEKYQKHTPGRGAIPMPSIPDVETRCKSFFQKAGNLLSLLEKMSKLFYPDELESKWIESLEKLAKLKGGNASRLADFLSDQSPLLFILMNARNAVEHEEPDKRVVVEDFTMSADQEIFAPTFEVIHPKTPITKSGAAISIRYITEEMVGITEVMMAFLCAANVQPFAGMDVVVDALPEARRRNGVTFGYLIHKQGEWCVLG